METAGSGSIRLLLVDDHPEIAAVTETHLERLKDGFDVVVEHSADDALERLDEDIDCVVSDYEMPDKDGLDFLRDVREHDSTIPFVLFTSRGSEEIASEAISAGVTDYLQKESGTDQYAVLANRVENAVARRRSAAAAEESESRYRRLVESSPHAIFVHHGDEIIYANERMAELVAAEDPADLYGREPLSFTHPDDRATIRDRIDRVIESDAHHDWIESRLRGLDGTVRWVESRASPVTYDGKEASQVVLRDVTERRRRERRLATLHEATRRLLTADDRRAVAEITVDVLEDVFEEPVAVLWRYDPDDEALVPLAATDRAAAQTAVEADPGVPTLPADTVEMETFEGGEARVVRDYPETDGAVTDDIATTFLVPLSDYGMLGTAALESRSFDAPEREIAGILGRSVVAAFDRLAEEDRLADANRSAGEDDPA